MEPETRGLNFFLLRLGCTCVRLEQVRKPKTMRLIALLAFLPLCACGGSPAAEGADRGEHLKEWARITEEAAAADGPPLSSLPLAEEWYQVTIADVPVGYMNTLTSVDDDGSARSMEVMDVQVNRGADTSRMAFETVFQEAPLQPPSLEVLEEAQRSTGGVTLMAYDQRFANNEVKMGLTFPDGEMKLVSFNGEKEHVSMLPRPEQAWLGRLRARLEFTRQCRAGATEIVVQTMRP